MAAFYQLNTNEFELELPEFKLNDCSHILAILRLGDYSSDAYIATDKGGNIIYANRSAKRLFGLNSDRDLGTRIVNIIPAIAKINSRLDDTNPQKAVLWRERGICVGGRDLNLLGAVTCVPSSSGKSYLYMIRERHMVMSDESNYQAELASLVYKNTSEGMIVLDSKGIILDVNPAFSNLRGRDERDVIGQHIRCLNSPCHDSDFYRAMWKTVLTTGRWQGEHWGQHANGELFPEWLSINTSYGVDNTVHRRVLIFSNISEIKKAEAIIWKQANFDPLTDLPNRQMFNDRLEQSIKKSQRTGKRAALLFLDLDRFKEVNDTLGHATGDDLLKETASRLISCIRQSDTVARLGGDEFVVLLDNIRELRDVERITRNILNILSQPFYLGLETIYISVSIGISFFPDDATAPDVLLNNADQAMYAAKTDGRNRFRYFTNSMQDKAQMRMRLVNDLHEALKQDQFVLHYQPIIDLHTGLIKKAETLIRWQHPVLGMVPPLDFIPLAEETGIIQSIGNWVFCESARQVNYWRCEFNQDLQISVNISPAQLRHESLDYAMWRGHLATLGLSPKHIVIEITESLLIDMADLHIKDQLDTFRDAGIQLALDDFGTGYSSLAYLSKFNIDYLKIDQSFVSNLSHNYQDLALCETVITLAHKLGLKVVAEGIETQEQYDLLKKANCDFGQGFLFSRPLPADEFEALLKSKNM